MRFGYSETCLEHDPGSRHPESPDRLRAVRATLESEHGARFQEPPPASRSAVTAVHEDQYVEDIEAMAADGGGRWDSDTVLNGASWDAALASAGLAIWAGEAAVPAADRDQLPFALGRPPGHHAVAADAMGFCLFNNAAVATQALLDAGTADRVAIFDWDVHHGNGTQAIFLDRPDVPYISIHEEGLYPGTGALEETGAGATLNVPLSPGAEDAAYFATVDRVIDPWLERHDPDVLLVSAGFDAHRHDPISRMAVSTEGFGRLTESVLAIAEAMDTRLGMILEGGYGLDTLAESVRMVHRVCGGYEPAPPESTLRPVDDDRIDAARSVHGLGS